MELEYETYQQLGVDEKDISIIDFVELVRNISFKNPKDPLSSKGLRLYGIDEETYVSVLVDSLMSNSLRDSEIMKKGIYSLVNIKEIVNQSIYSEELTRVIIEKTIMYALTASNFYIRFYVDNTLFKDGNSSDVTYVRNMIEELIDLGMISGSDIVHFIDRDKARMYISSVLVANTAKMLKDAFKGMNIDYDNNMLFLLGWTGDRLHFIEGLVV